MTWFKKYLLPGFIFQSVLIGGGYGTGRELIEFFMTSGPVSGYLGMLVSVAVWGLVMAITYELVRLTRSYDYKSFLSNILGRGWVIYEALFILTSILVVSVMASAAGELTSEILNVESIYGAVVMMILVGLIVFYGTNLIEKLFSVWSIFLYMIYIILIIIAWSAYHDEIVSTIMFVKGDHTWLVDGVRYAGYNIAVLPALLYSARHIETRKEALSSGLIGGFLAMIPAVFIFTAMLGEYPQIVSEAIPANFLLGQLDMPFFTGLFQIILFGTFIETGVGYIHGFNERIAAVYQSKGKEMPGRVRVLVAAAVLLTAVFLANQLGLIALIAKGYGWITWGFIIIYVVPILTIGIYRINQLNE